MGRGREDSISTNMESLARRLIESASPPRRDDRARKTTKITSSADAPMTDGNTQGRSNTELAELGAAGTVATIVGAGAEGGAGVTGGGV